MKMFAILLSGAMLVAAPVAVTTAFAKDVTAPKASANVADMAATLVAAANKAEADAMATKSSPDAVNAAIQVAINTQIQAFIANGASPADITAAVALAASGNATCAPDPKNVAICKPSKGVLAALNAAQNNLAALFGTGPGAVNSRNNNPDGSVPQAQVVVVPGTNYRGS